MVIEAKGLLKDIKLPSDLRELDKEELKQVCDELRDFLIENASENGGHFAASLGVVEITVALHYIFNTPKDKIVWDVGHQAYGHKILTGRREEFHTNREYDGIAPFPKMAESEYDTFGVGHSSTSISAALGMAMAAKVSGDEESQHIAVIGDGSMTGGMAFEALNNGGVSDSNLIVVLNDNCMSIDPNVGALKEYLTDITVSKHYNRLRDEMWDILGKFKGLGESAREVASRLEKNVKGMVSKQANFFESLGFRYFGPIDGHDVDHVAKVLEDLKKIPGPKLLHCLTQKGKGYTPAEKDPLTWHAPGTFEVSSGKIHKAPPKTEPPKYQDVFGNTLLELAEHDKEIMGVTPAMPSGSSMKIMMEAMPDRALDVGIAEQHAVTFSAGLATKGKKVFCNIYSSFMQRAFDQVVHDVAIQSLPVVFCLDRAGIAGEDGATHHGAYDIAYMRCIPNMIVSAPRNEHELRKLMKTAHIESERPFSIRYPRGKGVLVDWKCDLETVEVGKGVWLNHGEKISVLSLGHCGNFATKAIENISKDGSNIGHADLRFVKPIDKDLIIEAANKYDKIVTLEDGCLPGGFGSAVIEVLADANIQVEVHRIGIPDRIVEHGPQGRLHEEIGIDAQSVEKRLRELL